MFLDRWRLIRLEKLVSVTLLYKGLIKSRFQMSMEQGSFMYLEKGGWFTDLIYKQNNDIYLSREYRL